MLAKLKVSKLQVLKRRPEKKKPKAAAIPARSKSHNRALKTPKYRSFRLSKRIKHPAPRLPKARVLLWRSLKVLWSKKWLFAGIMTVFALLYAVLVRGLVGSDLTVLKDALDESNGVSSTQATQGVGLVVYLMGNLSAPNSETASLYQLLLLVLVSMALIWALRQVLSDKPQSGVTIKNAYYKGTAAFVPYSIVLMLIGIQLIPALIGISVYQQVITSGLAASSVESFVWLVVMSSLVFLTLYLLSASLFALQIITLPDVTPVQALRSAKQLVHFRRFEVMRKLVFMPFVLMIVGLIVFLPIVLYLTPVAEVLFFIGGVTAVAIGNSYMYQLYRSLL